MVLRPGENVAADELARFVAERLAAFNVPSRFWFLSDPLPRNPAGKVLKNASCGPGSSMTERPDNGVARTAG